MAAGQASAVILGEPGRGAASGGAAEKRSCGSSGRAHISFTGETKIAAAASDDHSWEDNHEATTRYTTME